MKFENVALTEEEMLNDTLASCKSLMSLLNIYATEASNEEIEDVIAEAILLKKVQNNSVVEIDEQNGKLTFNF